MKMPGFTAEAAIYDTAARYSITDASQVPAKGAVVSAAGMCEHRPMPSLCGR
jgi:hypothetical protein